VGSALYVLGGVSNGASTVNVLKFDGIDGIWSEVAPMPERRDSIATCVVGTSIYVFGGEEDEVGNTQTSVFKYDTEANE
jgi:N-acetylneuraminic acid mutarotase